MQAKSEADKKELEQLRSQREEELRELAEIRAERERERRELAEIRAERERERRELAEIRAEREEDRKRQEVQSEEYETEVQRLRTEAAEAVKNAEADRVQLEEEVHRIQQEKVALQGMKLSAEKAVRERDDELQKVAGLLKAKEDEIRQKENELKAMYDAANLKAIDAAEQEPTAADEQEASSSGHYPVRVEPQDPLDPDDLLSDDEREAMTDDTFWFPLPEKFSEAKATKPTEMELFEMIQLVPEYVRRAIMTFMPESPESASTATAKLAFEYSRSGRLPNWLVIWFMRAVRVIDKKSSDEVLYIKAMHLLAALRERIIRGEMSDF